MIVCRGGITYILARLGMKTLIKPLINILSIIRLQYDVTTLWGMNMNIVKNKYCAINSYIYVSALHSVHGRNSN